MKLLVEFDHDFDIENFNKSARCMKCARQLLETQAARTMGIVRMAAMARS